MPATLTPTRHRFVLDKTSRPIARRALLVGQQFFDVVIIERGHVGRFRMRDSLTTTPSKDNARAVGVSLGSARALACW